MEKGKKRVIPLPDAVRLALSIVKLFTFTWLESMWSIGDNRHTCVLTPGKRIAGDVQSMKLNMMLTGSRWNSSSDYYLTRSNHVGNTLWK